MKKLIILIISMSLLIAVLIYSAEKKVYNVVSEKCIGCRLCERECPTKAISMIEGKAVIDQKKCINCGICFNTCPVKAIEIKSEAKNEVQIKQDKTSKTEENVKKKSDETGKTTLETSIGTEVSSKSKDLNNNEDVLSSEDNTNSSVNLTSEEDIVKGDEDSKIFKPFHKVQTDVCIGCQICIPECPVDAITLKNGKAFIDSEKCINCGICAQKCPVKAIEEENPFKK